VTNRQRPPASSKPREAKSRDARKEKPRASKEREAKPRETQVAVKPTTPPTQTISVDPNVRGMVAVQIATADVVGRVLAGKNLDRELANVLTHHPNISASERQAVHSIAFDTLRHYGLFAAQLDTLLSQPLSDLPVRHLLLVALAQLQYSKAAAHAVVDQAVTAVEAMGLGRAKGLTNAVLRNYLRAPDKFKRERFKDLVARYDFPRWWIERLKQEQPEHWEDVLASARARPPMHLRVNARATNVEQYLSQLANAGISAAAIGGNAIALEQAVGVTALPRFAEGDVSVQDFGAQHAAQFLDLRNGMRVLDACAAPGGKTAHILELADVKLTAVDTDKVRLPRVVENLKRLKLNAHVVQGDTTAPEMWWSEGKPVNVFDRILLDAPCSGSGVTRRHPDIKWIRRETDLKRFQTLQLALLRACWKMLKPGGKLLYVTCSIFRAENHEVVMAFLAEENSASRLPLSSNADAVPDWHLDGQLLPTSQHDGFYYALLAKRA
jgi:16S rRNA (cytosine967-C5)-methyltransferase